VNAQSKLKHALIAREYRVAPRLTDHHQRHESIPPDCAQPAALAFGRICSSAGCARRSRDWKAAGAIVLGKTNVPEMAIPYECDKSSLRQNE
jgi:hypothetical protein